VAAGSASLLMASAVRWRGCCSGASLPTGTSIAFTIARCYATGREGELAAVEPNKVRGAIADSFVTVDSTLTSTANANSNVTATPTMPQTQKGTRFVSWWHCPITGGMGCRGLVSSCFVRADSVATARRLAGTRLLTLLCPPDRSTRR
jgi:hypothetical protein